jgi:transmembrane sensor
MKVMKKIERYTEKEWIELASQLSGEKDEQTDLLNRFMAEDVQNISSQWKELKNMNNETNINVDNAWKNVQTRIKMDSFQTGTGSLKSSLLRRSLFRLAAAALIILSLGTTGLYLRNKDVFSKRITVATNNDQKNLLVSLPDGSKIVLNRNTQFSYHANFGEKSRNVKLTGEAFFDISKDTLKPFIIDAGNASVKVVGTSFNVITNNAESACEVYVKTGKVMLSGNSGAQSVILNPEFVGTINLKSAGKSLNKNPNYLAWRTEKLFYNGQKLEVVFHDLKRVYNMDIVADDNSITDNIWTSPIETQSQDTIIRLICGSFNLSYTKDGSVYHLGKK